jgi:hypothetical protein
LLAKDEEEENAWHLAAMFGRTESLDKIWECTKAKLSTEEINKKLLLSINNRKMTAWHVAAE